MDWRAVAQVGLLAGLVVLGGCSETEATLHVTPLDSGDGLDAVFTTTADLDPANRDAFRDAIYGYDTGADDGGRIDPGIYLANDSVYRVTGTDPLDATRLSDEPAAWYLDRHRSAVADLTGLSAASRQLFADAIEEGHYLGSASRDDWQGLRSRIESTPPVRTTDTDAIHLVEYEGTVSVARIWPSDPRSA